MTLVVSWERSDGLQTSIITIHSVHLAALGEIHLNHQRTHWSGYSSCKALISAWMWLLSGSLNGNASRVRVSTARTLSSRAAGACVPAAARGAAEPRASTCCRAASTLRSSSGRPRSSCPASHFSVARGSAARICYGKTKQGAGRGAMSWRPCMSGPERSPFTSRMAGGSTR